MDRDKKKSYDSISLIMKKSNANKEQKWKFHLLNLH